MAKRHSTLLKEAKNRAQLQNLAIDVAEALTTFLGREVKVDWQPSASLCVREGVSILRADAEAILAKLKEGTSK